MTTSVKTASNAAGAGELERLLAGARPRHLVAELAEQGLGEGADLLIVLDQQDPAGAPRFERRPRLRRPAAAAPRSLHGQEQGDGRAFAGRALDPHVAARLGWRSRRPG